MLTLELVSSLSRVCASLSVLTLPGIPTLAPSFLPEDVKVWVQSENGLLGMGPYPTEDEVDP